MITLEQAIELATKIHKGQWRKSEPTTTEEFNQIDKTTRISPVSDTHFILDNDTNIYTENTNKFGKPIIKGALSKRPYITHPLAVMSMMDTEEEKIVAVLHDVFEDSKAQLCNHAKEYNFNEREYSIRFVDTTYSITPNLWAALYALTKPNSDWDKFKEKGNYQSYAGYIKNITMNKTATKVKIADIVHNLSCYPSERAKQKYLKAMPVLLKSV